MASIRDTLAKLLAKESPSAIQGTPLGNAYPDVAQPEAPLEAPFLSPDDLIGMGIGKAALAPLIAGMVKNPSVQKALVNKTAQELAHETAQKNAVEMLGLPKGNTAMDRAKAMGYTTPAYHGTVSDDVKQLRDLFYSAKNPKMASEYANPDYIGGGLLPTDSPNVIPTLNRLGSNKKLNRWSQYENQFSLDENPNYWMDEGYTSATFAEPGRAKDAVYLNYYPQDVRSRFAAFDPKLTGAAAIAAGTASADLLADEDKQKLIKALKQQ